VQNKAVNDARLLEKAQAGDEAREEARARGSRADVRSKDGDGELLHGEKPGSEPLENEPLMPNYCETSGSEGRRAEGARKARPAGAAAAAGTAGAGVAPLAAAAVAAVAVAAGQMRTLK
jgi:hypothetical protein